MREHALAQTGKQILIAMIVIVFVISLTTSLTNILFEIEGVSWIKEIIRWAFTIWLMISLYRGKKWARVLAIVLYSLGFVLIIGMVVTVPQTWDLHDFAPLGIGLLLAFYAYFIYFLWLSKSFKAFEKKQRGELPEIEIEDLIDG